MDELVRELKNDEGLRLRAYQDHLGIWTAGYGTNLQVLEISEGLAERWLRDKVDYIRLRADKMPIYTLLSSVRKDVILSMMYQLGVQGTLNFKNMWKEIELGQFIGAAVEMRDSRWWRDPKTKARAERMSNRMETGVW